MWIRRLGTGRLDLSDVGETERVPWKGRSPGRFLLMAMRKYTGLMVFKTLEARAASSAWCFLRDGTVVNFRISRDLNCDGAPVKTISGAGAFPWLL